MDYNANTSIEADGQGNLSRIKLTIPAGTIIAENVKAMVVLDVFPLYEKALFH